MAPSDKSRRAAASTVGHLQFASPLTAKSLSNSELLKRLQALHSELSQLDQDTVVTSTLDDVAKQLISNSLLLHKEKAIKALVGCAICDVLRLYAPDAPYSQSELRDLFQFLFRQLKHLSSADDAQYQKYYYLIESLANVKSIVIICDLDDGEELMLDLFKTVFDVVDSKTPTPLLLLLTDLLSQILIETPTIPSDLVDLILTQFLPKSIKNNPTAFKIAADLCDESLTGDKLGKFVAQYFIEVFTKEDDGEADEEEDDEDEDEGDDEMDEDSDDDDDGAAAKKKKKKAGKKAAGKKASKAGGKSDGTKEKESLPSGFSVAHSLIVQLHSSAPSLLLNVIPLLTTELTSASPLLRILATTTLAKMLAVGSTVKSDLIRDYSGVWKEWLGRGLDRDWRVREAVANGVGKVWTGRGELRADLEDALKKLLLDSDDRVRTAAVNVFMEMDYETAWNHCSAEMLKAAGERCLDKKASVRNVTFRALGRLYDLAFTDIESKDERAIVHFAWIPGTLATAQSFTSDATIHHSIRATLDQTFLTYILPQQTKEKDLLAPGNTKEEEWTDQLLTVLAPLGEGERRWVLKMTRLAEKRPGPFVAFISVCEKNNGGVIDADADAIKTQLKTIVKFIAARCPDPVKATEDLNKFAKANEKQLYKLFKTLLDPQTDLKLQAKTYKDCLRRLEQISPSIVETFTIFIRSSCYLILNRSSVSTLLKRLQQPATSQIATYVLNFITKQRPILYKSHVSELTKCLSEGSKEGVVEAALHCASRLFKEDSSLQPDKKLLERAQHYAMNGTAVQAKQAATIVAHADQKPGEADDLVHSNVKFLADELPTASEEDLIIRFTALNRLARFARDSFESKSEEITTSVLEVLARDLSPGELTDDDDELWVDDESVDNLTKARVLGIKVIASRCLAFADDPETADTIATPAFEMLFKFLKQREDSSRYNAAVGSRMRLAAAESILKLSTKSIFHKEIFKSFEQLSRMAQDTCYEVRLGFVTRLLTYLRNDRILAPRLNMILFIVAHDPEDEIKTEVTNYVKNRFRGLSIPARQAGWEYPFVRLAHLIAHHPDFVGLDDDEDSVKAMSKYLELYIDCIATKENVSYLYHLSLKLKTVRDAVSEEFDKNLYVLAELAQYLIRNKSKALGGTITTFPEAVKMPGDIFRTMPNTGVANQVSKTSYLSAALLDRIAPDIGKAPKVKSEPKIKPATTTKKRSSPKATKKAKRIKKRDEVLSDHDSDNCVTDEGDSSEDLDDGPKKPAVKSKKASSVKENPTPERKRPTLGRGAKAAPPGKKSSRKPLTTVSPLHSDEEMVDA